jgi:uncharacterized protein (DUF1015 family)
MADIRPFAAYRPRPELAVRVASPPYDVVSSAEAAALAEGNPYSFLHVARPEIDLPAGVDEHDEAVYIKGRENLEAFIAEGTLRQDAAPRLYVYAQTMGSHHQVGLVACASVADYEADIIKKHEKTRADKEDDRTKHIDVLSAHDEPVFLTYRAEPEIDAVVKGITQGEPAFDFTTQDGVAHRVWAADTELSQQLAARFAAVPALYVADGHHRSAAAARVHKLRRGDGGEHGFFLAVIFPHNQMNIMAYNRVVRDPQGRSAAALLEELRKRFDIVATSELGREKGNEAMPSGPKKFGVYAGGAWYEASVRAGSFDASDPVAGLDCSICQDQLLGPVFDVKDPRRDKHVDFVGGIRGQQELERRVDSGEMSIAIHLYPTQMLELMAVSDAGLLMPPKSTWFEPKLRSGLFVHVF